MKNRWCLSSVIGGITERFIATGSDYSARERHSKTARAISAGVYVAFEILSRRMMVGQTLESNRGT